MESAAQIEQAEVADNTADARDYEAEARVQGWRSKEELEAAGKTVSNWKDAETFVRDGEERAGLQKNQIANLKQQIDMLQRTVKRLTKAEASAYENAMRDIEARMESAVEAGDVEAYRKLNKAAKDLNEQAKDDAQPHLKGEDPQEQFEAFREANAWYDKANLASASEIEVEARLYADRLAERYTKQGLQTQMAPSEFFAKIAEEVEGKFPLLKAKAPRQKPQSDVAGVTRVPGNRNARNGAALPPEAKRQAERFFNQGVIKAKDLSEALDKYAKNYQWD